MQIHTLTQLPLHTIFKSQTRCTFSVIQWVIVLFSMYIFSHSVSHRPVFYVHFQSFGESSSCFLCTFQSFSELSSCFDVHFQSFSESSSCFVCTFSVIQWVIVLFWCTFSVIQWVIVLFWCTFSIIQWVIVLFWCTFSVIQWVIVLFWCTFSVIQWVIVLFWCIFHVDLVVSKIKNFWYIFRTSGIQSSDWSCYRRSSWCNNYCNDHFRDPILHEKDR